MIKKKMTMMSTQLTKLSRSKRREKKRKEKKRREEKRRERREKKKILENEEISLLLTFFTDLSS